MKRLVVMTVLPVLAGAQCVQCFRTAAAQQAASIAAMNRGILLLLIPVFGLLAGFCWLAYQRRDP